MIRVFRCQMFLVFLDTSDEVCGTSVYSPVLKTQEAAENLGKTLLRMRQISGYLIIHSFDGDRWYNTTNPVGSYPKPQKYIPDIDEDVVHAEPREYIRREKYLYDLDQERSRAKNNQNDDQTVAPGVGT